MDIKEAIIHARQIGERGGVDGRDCAYQHDCLVDWLEELVAYRAKIPFDRLDEAAALVKAQDEGRAVVLPCNVGDTVFQRCYKRAEELKIVSRARIGCGAEGEDGKLRFLDWDVFGKTVFLTRQEAEAALEEQDG